MLMHPCFLAHAHHALAHIDLHAAPMPGSFPMTTLVPVAVARGPLASAIEPGQHKLVLSVSYELAPPCSGAATVASQEVFFTVTPAPVLQVSKRQTSLA